jgi:3-phenylpropionate/cinnamic acid dioxygenase small subunit
LGSDRDEIENLLARYCSTYDAGDFEAYAALFTHGRVVGPTGSFDSPEQIVEYHRRNCRLYDGSPRTRHVNTNLEIHVDEGAGTATASSYVTIYQATPDFPLQVIFVGRYLDELTKIDGTWWFARREAVAELVGDLSAHALEYLPPS